MHSTMNTKLIQHQTTFSKNAFWIHHFQSFLANNVYVEDPCNGVRNLCHSVCAFGKVQTTETNFEIPSRQVPQSGTKLPGVDVFHSMVGRADRWQTRTARHRREDWKGVPYAPLRSDSAAPAPTTPERECRTTTTPTGPATQNWTVQTRTAYAGIQRHGERH